MSEANNPLGTDLNTAQNAIRAMIAPEEDTVTEPDALEAEAVEVEAEMPEEAEEYEQEYATEDEGEFAAEDDAGEHPAALLRIFSSARGKGPRYALPPMLKQRPLMWRQCVLAIHRMPKLLEFRTTQTVLNTFAISCWARSLRTKFDHLAIPTG